MLKHTGDNLARLMAAQGLTVHLVVQRTGVDPRTIRSILHSFHKPHAKTLHRLADGLGVNVDEFFLDPAQLLYRRVDRRYPSAMTETIKAHGELFRQWTAADFENLHHCLDKNATLTVSNVLAAARRINERREFHDILSRLLESDQARIVCGILRLCLQETMGRRKITSNRSGTGGRPSR